MTVQNLTDAEVKREALGRGFALVGSLVGMTGTLLLLSTNPAVKTAAGSAYKRLPAVVQRNKYVGLAMVGGAIMLGVGWWLTKKMQGK